MDIGFRNMDLEFKQIRDLKAGMKNVKVVFIVLDIGRPNTTKEQHEVRSCKVADRTGCINISLWDEPGTLLQPGDIVSLNRGYVSIFKSCLTLYVSKGGELQKIGEFCMNFTEIPNMSEPNPEYSNINKSGGSVSGDGNSGGGQNNNSGGSNNNSNSNSARDPRLLKPNSNGAQIDPRSLKGGGTSGGSTNSISQPNGHSGRHSYSSNSNKRGVHSGSGNNNRNSSKR
ncbi:SOSS complex subunit B1 [Armadillidium nasatum]|uniref:SOSS complex subunit B1 n=1 Tax=Armadillidium nasatum TaxID=96803 RepID=A0A5N5SW87_9CRUS|nr:SOSS complex subunit B1 [Armadillidium nasatum]